jgi:hypothetical protein
MRARQRRNTLVLDPLAFISTAIGIMEAAIITTAPITAVIIITKDILPTGMDTGITAVADIDIKAADMGIMAEAHRCRLSDLTKYNPGARCPCTGYCSFAGAGFFKPLFGWEIPGVLRPPVKIHGVAVFQSRFVEPSHLAEIEHRFAVT